MIHLGKKHYIYFDLAMLQDADCIYLLEGFADAYKRMFVVVKCQAEEEVARKLEFFDYICEVIYDVKQMKHKTKHVCFITKKDIAPAGFDSILICASEYVTISEFLDINYKSERNRRIAFNTICFLCMLFYVVLFAFENMLSLTLFEDTGIACLIPALLFGFTILYGIYAGVYRPSIVLAFLDGFY